MGFFHKWFVGRTSGFQMAVCLGLTVIAGAGIGWSETMVAQDPMGAEAYSRPHHQTIEAPSDVREAIARMRATTPDRRLLPGPQKTLEALLDESFEDTWPVLPWSVEHADGKADVDWGQTSYRASAGTKSIWCAQTGPDSPGSGQPAPANTKNWSIVGPFQLTETTTGTFSFDLWLRSESFHDFFMVLASIDGESFHGEARSGDSQGWQHASLALENWPNIGALTGQDEVWFAFLYQSDHSENYEGAYVDAVMLEVDTGEGGDVAFVYTTTQDFEQGTMVGLEADSNNLQLADGWNAWPNLWVPSSANGTVSKIDVASGDELARYRTGPDRELDPSAVAVDLDGDCWVANRGAGTVVKIGLSEADRCIDRNGNGSIDTSSDDDEDGDISGDELLAWGDDECVLYEVSLVDSQEAVFVPGTEHENYAENHIRGMAVDHDNDVWVGVYDAQKLYRLDGVSAGVLESVDVSDSETRPYDLAVDSNGALWVSARPDPWLLVVDPVTGTQTTVDLAHQSNGLGLDGLDHLFVTGFTDSSLSRVGIDDGTVDWVVSADWEAQGVAATEDGSIWVAAPGSQIVRRYTNGGAAIAPFEFVNRPSAVAVDANGRVWITGQSNDTLVRVDSLTNVADLQKEVLDAGYFDCSGDMTGIVARSIASKFGSWYIVVDGELEDMPWSTVTWEADEPGGTRVLVNVCSSDDQITWSDEEKVSNGGELQSTPPGRYLRVELGLQVVSGDEVPVIQEVTVKPVVEEDAPVADFSWAPVSPLVDQEVVFSDVSSGAPTAWSWDFGDGATSAEQNPTSTYSAAGQYQVTLEVSNDGGSDAFTQSITVQAIPQCELSCSAAAPATAWVDEEVNFSGEAVATNCSGDLQYSWDFGNGGSDGGQNPAFAYAEIGDFTWTMQASVDDETCSATGSISIDYDGPDECTFTYWVPVVSRASGANDSLWRTDLGMLGVGDSKAKAELRFFGPQGERVRNTHVGRQNMVDIADVVGWISLDDGVSGALSVCADGELVTTTRTFNLLSADDLCAPNGTFGQRIDGVETVEGLDEGESAVLPQLRENGAFRTNLGFTNGGIESAELEIVLFDEIGTALVGFTVELQSGEWMQENRPFFNRAGVDDLDAGWARVTVLSGAGVFVYGSVIDNDTNDATTVNMR